MVAIAEWIDDRWMIGDADVSMESVEGGERKKERTEWGGGEWEEAGSKKWLGIWNFLFIGNCQLTNQQTIIVGWRSGMGAEMGGSRWRSGVNYVEEKGIVNGWTTGNLRVWKSLLHGNFTMLLFLCRNFWSVKYLIALQEKDGWTNCRWDKCCDR